MGRAGKGRRTGRSTSSASSSSADDASTVTATATSRSASTAPRGKRIARRTRGRAAKAEAANGREEAAAVADAQEEEETTSRSIENEQKRSPKKAENRRSKRRRTSDHEDAEASESTPASSPAPMRAPSPPARAVSPQNMRSPSPQRAAGLPASPSSSPRHSAAPAIQRSPLSPATVPWNPSEHGTPPPPSISSGASAIIPASSSPQSSMTSPYHQPPFSAGPSPTPSGFYTKPESYPSPYADAPVPPSTSISAANASQMSSAASYPVPSYYPSSYNPPHSSSNPVSYHHYHHYQPHQYNFSHDASVGPPMPIAVTQTSQSTSFMATYCSSFRTKPLIKHSQARRPSAAGDPLSPELGSSPSPTMIPPGSTAPTYGSYRLKRPPPRSTIHAPPASSYPTHPTMLSAYSIPPLPSPSANPSAAISSAVATAPSAASAEPSSTSSSDFADLEKSTVNASPVMNSMQSTAETLPHTLAASPMLDTSATTTDPSSSPAQPSSGPGYYYGGQAPSGYYQPSSNANYPYSNYPPYAYPSSAPYPYHYRSTSVPPSYSSAPYPPSAVGSSPQFGYGPSSMQADGSYVRQSAGEGESGQGESAMRMGARSREPIMSPQMQRFSSPQPALTKYQSPPPSPIYTEWQNMLSEISEQQAHHTDKKRGAKRSHTAIDNQPKKPESTKIKQEPSEEEEFEDADSSKKAPKWTDLEDAVLINVLHESPCLESVLQSPYLVDRFAPEHIKERWAALLYDSSLAQDTAARIDELDFDLPLPTSRPQLSSTYSQPPQASAPAVNGVNAEEGASVPQVDSKPAQDDAQSGSSRAFLGSELDFVPFSRMEQKLLKDITANRPMDFFSRIARKEAYYNAAERLREHIIKLETELRWLNEKKRKMLALLRGRFLRYEMKTKEIVVGRGASDSVVDVDLKEEGDATKVSRRQALIKMKRDGEFYIHNVGRATIFVNGSPVPTGKRHLLTHCCLIEIRQLAFIFEINRELVAKIRHALDTHLLSSQQPQPQPPHG